MSLVVSVSVGMQLGLAAFNQFAMPKSQPAKIGDAFVFLSTAVAIICTTKEISVSPAAWPISPVGVLGVLLAMALLPPLLGLIEAKVRKDGARVFAKARFRGHLLSNTLGALAAAAFVWSGRSTPGFDAFAVQFQNTAAFNVVLPMTTIVILAFVRWQQVDQFTDLDKFVESGRKDEWQHEICGYSLKHWHQFTNTLYMIVVTFTGATMILYLFAFAMVRAKTGEPLDFSWQIGLAMTVLLLFVCACGSPWSRDNRAVYLTFLTGTPAVLVIALIWLALLKNTVTRNVVAISIIGVGYILYCTGAVLGSRNSNEKVEIHYFSAAAFAVALTLLVGALYYS